ncbi:transposase [Streptomyces adustus]|uniref:transposase n=1 Tax=Streptomyces adustus TaxID=1609272 RepID=UPI0037208501
MEPRRRMRDYVRGLLGPVGRKNGRQLAEYAGHATPDGLQHLLSRSRWDADRLRDDLQFHAAEQLGPPEGVLIIDDTGFINASPNAGGWWAPGRLTRIPWRRSQPAVAGSRSAHELPMPCSCLITDR